MFTQKHFVALAAGLARLRPAGANAHATAKDKHKAEGAFEQWQETVRGIADLCASHNPKFDRAKFLKASTY